MLCYGAQQLATSFRTVRANTIKVAEDIPEEKYSFCPFEGARSVAQMLTHIALSPRLWVALHGSALMDVTTFDFGKWGATMRTEEAVSRTKPQIIDLLTTEGEAFASFLEGLSDARLSEQVLTYASGVKVHKPRLEMVLGAKEHEMHHRAQLMLIERQLGIVPHLTRQMQARMEQMTQQRAGV
jgi:uncharacterized damage-inducible protein DinB